MEALSMHFCFQLTADPTSNQELMSLLQTLPGEFLKTVGTLTDVGTDSGDRLLLATDTEGSHLLVHIYRGGFVTIDIQHASTKNNENLVKQRCSFAVIGPPVAALRSCWITHGGQGTLASLVLVCLPRDHELVESRRETGKAIENRIKEVLEDKCEFTRSIPSPLRRGRVCPYFQKGNDTMYEHKVDELLYETDSEWQNVKIFKTPNFGNMLCLDDVIMLAESDDIYTQTLLGTDRNNFTNKTILILGGGDGGLLYELLKHSPKFVLMAEFEVIKACRTYMRSICGGSLDQLTGDNYKVRIDDCVKVLQECLNNKTRFDYIINDLSEYLINTDVGHQLDFVTSAKILEMSMEILEHDGKYLSRGDSVSEERATKAFERDIETNRLQCKKFIVDVPSYGEKYCFYEIWKAAIQNGEI